MPESENTIADLKRWLSRGDKPVSMEEFKAFWDSCTEAEKVEFKQTRLE